MNTAVTKPALTILLSVEAHAGCSAEITVDKAGVANFARFVKREGRFDPAGRNSTRRTASCYDRPNDGPREEKEHHAA